MVGIPHYNAFLRHLSNQCTNLASSSVIFLATQSTAFLWPGNLYLSGSAVHQRGPNISTRIELLDRERETSKKDVFW